MRSIRHRKLMEAARRMAHQEPLSFEFTLAHDNTCHCEVEVWQEEALLQLEQGTQLEPGMRVEQLLL